MPRFSVYTAAAPARGAAVGAHMRYMTAVLCAAALLAGCDEERFVTVLFTGDDRGWVVPAG